MAHVAVATIFQFSCLENSLLRAVFLFIILLILYMPLKWIFFKSTSSLYSKTKGPKPDFCTFLIQQQINGRVHRGAFWALSKKKAGFVATDYKSLDDN